MTPTNFSEKLLSNIIGNCSDKDLNQSLAVLKEYRLRNNLRGEVMFKNHPFARSVIQLIEEESNYRNEQLTEDPTNLS